MKTINLKQRKKKFTKSKRKVKPKEKKKSKLYGTCGLTKARRERKKKKEKEEKKHMGTALESLTLSGDIRQEQMMKVKKF